MLKGEVFPAEPENEVLVAVTHWPTITPETGTATDVPLAVAEPMQSRLAKDLSYY